MLELLNNKKSGEYFGTIKILGNDYNVIVIYSRRKDVEINIKEKQIEILMPNKYKKINCTAIVNNGIGQLYYKIAEEEIEKVMEKTRVMLNGLAPEDYKIQKMNDKLASYSNVDRIITINPSIIKYSRDVIEYTILYEFCRLKYKKQSKNFIKMLAMYMPNFREYEYVSECI